jgi:hypothetical protein
MKEAMSMAVPDLLPECHHSSTFIELLSSSNKQCVKAECRVDKAEDKNFEVLNHQHVLPRRLTPHLHCHKITFTTEKPLSWAQFLLVYGPDFVPTENPDFLPILRTLTHMTSP